MSYSWSSQKGELGGADRMLVFTFVYSRGVSAVSINEATA